MSKINQDGLVAGQSVDFETLMKVQLGKKNEKQTPKTKAKAKPKAKVQQSK